MRFGRRTGTISMATSVCGYGSLVFKRSLACHATLKSRKTAISGCYSMVRRRLHDSVRPSTINGTIPKNGHGIEKAQYAEVNRVFTQEEVRLYGNLIGDNNLLHQQIDESLLLTQSPEMEVLRRAGLIRLQDNGKTIQQLVHGMMVASVFSCIFGTLIPGSVYRSQSLKFRAPVFANEPIVGRVEVTAVRSVRDGVVVKCDTKVLKSKTELCVEGEAIVWLPGVEK